MKSHITTIIIFIILCSVILLFFDIKIKTEFPLLDCDRTEIESIVFQRPHDDDLVLYSDHQSEASLWKVKYKTWDEATHQETIDYLLLYYCKFPYEEKFPVSDFSEQDYLMLGFDHPMLKLIIKEKINIELIIGSEIPSKTGYYVKTNLQPDFVFTVPNSILNKIQLNYLDLRLRALIDLRAATWMTLNYFDHQVHFNKIDNEWRLGEGVKENFENVPDLVKLIQSLGYEHYHGPFQTDSESEEYGFSLPDVKISVENEQEGLAITYDLSLYNGKMYLRVLGAYPYYVYILNLNNAENFYNILRKSVE